MAGARAAEGTWGKQPFWRIPMQNPMHKRDFTSLVAQQGRVGYILLWLLGVPIPILFMIYLLRGCT
jgi:hypothetical protein